MSAPDPSRTDSQGPFQPRLVPSSRAPRPTAKDLAHQRVREEALRAQYELLQQNFESLRTTQRDQAAELEDARRRLRTVDGLEAELEARARELEAAQALHGELRAAIEAAEVRDQETERLAAETATRHAQELQGFSRSRLEHARELQDLRRDLESAREQARRLQRELRASVDAERALEAYSDRLEKRLRGRNGEARG